MDIKINQIAPGKEVQATYVENSISESRRPISPEHERYLLERHGTLALDPLPSADPEDPLNWPSWKKEIQIFLVAFHAGMNTFTAAGIISAFAPLATKYGVSIDESAYLVAVQILFLGVFPFFWNPLSNRFGRRPIFLISTLGSLASNTGGFFCKSYGTQMLSRILVSIFGCPPLGFGSAVVTELFFTHERAQKMGWWTLLITLGIPGGPLIMGFVVQHLGIDWVFGIFAIANAIQFLAYLIFNAETLYDRSESSPRPQNQKRNRFRFHRLDPTPLTLGSFFAPLNLITKVKVVIPAVAFALVFCYANTAITVELPKFYGELFHFNAQQVGLQYISVIIGAAIGEQLSGPMSDWFVNRYTRRVGHSHPVHRLWIGYIGFITVFIGIIVWGIELEKIEKRKRQYTVVPLVGAAFSNFGSQVITTTMTTFAVDNYRERSGDVGLFVNVIRQIWAFLGPFYFPGMYDTLGFAGASGALCALIFVFGVIPIAVIHYQGREKKTKTETTGDSNLA